jgi:hypothetical protein
VDKSESRERGEARQRDHEQMCDLLAGLLTAFVEEGRQSARSMVPDPLALLSPALVNQVSSTTILYVCDSNVCIPTYSRIHKTLYLSRHRGAVQGDQVVSPRPRSADRKRSMPLSKNSIILY